MAELTRRNFFKGAAVAAGAAALTTMVGCSGGSASADWEPEWTNEADIVVVGAGGAGLAAGIEARRMDMEVLILESMSMVGGNSAICGGGVSMAGTPLQKEAGYEDSPELMFNDLMNAGGIGQNEDYLHKISELNVGLWDFLGDLGVGFKEGGLIGSAGMSVPREHHVKAGDVVNALHNECDNLGAEIMLETPGKHLIVHPVTGRVIGVEAEHKGEKLFIKARKGVLLCTGGYARNIDFINQYCMGAGAEQYKNTTYDAEGQNGEGHLMAMEIGAQGHRLDYISNCSVQNPDEPIGVATAMYHVGAILVNQEGDRFVNDGLGYGKVWPAINKQTGQYCYQIWDQAIADEYMDNDTLYYNHSKVVATGAVVEADTIEELATKIGADPATMKAAVDAYNADIAATGKDSRFGREFLVSTSGTPVEIKNAPFYAFKTANALMTTFGGIKQDDQCRAVTVTGESIEGLYLAGNISGYCNLGVEPNSRQAYDTSGTGFGGAMTFGRYCAKLINDLEPWA